MGRWQYATKGSGPSIAWLPASKDTPHLTKFAPDLLHTLQDPFGLGRGRFLYSFDSLSDRWIHGLVAVKLLLKTSIFECLEVMDKL